MIFVFIIVQTLFRCPKYLLLAKTALFPRQINGIIEMKSKKYTLKAMKSAIGKLGNYRTIGFS